MLEIILSGLGNICHIAADMVRNARTEKEVEEAAQMLAEMVADYRGDVGVVMQEEFKQNKIKFNPSERQRMGEIIARACDIANERRR